MVTEPFEEGESPSEFTGWGAYERRAYERRAKKVGLSWENYKASLKGARLVNPFSQEFSQDEWRGMTLMERKREFDSYSSAASDEKTPPAVIEAANAMRGTW